MADRLLADRLRRNLPQRDGHAQGGRAAVVAHGLVCIVHHHVLSPALGIQDALRGQQRAFDLHKMHVRGIVDARLRHQLQGHAPALLHNGHGALLLRQEIPGKTAAHRQPFLSGSGRPVLMFAENSRVRGHNPLRSAGHHEGHLLRHLGLAPARFGHDQGTE